jgi:tetratricopeptide (TPR) repeat protein
MKNVIMLAIAVTPMLLGCTSSKNVLAENTTLFLSGKYEEAHKAMQPLLEKTSNESYPLYQLTDASMLYALGDLSHTSSLLYSAAQNLEVELGVGTIAVDLLGSEENTHYRGYVHERVLARYLLGVAYLRRGDLDSARIAFQQAIERDINKEAGKENTFASLHFMMGETCLRQRDYDNAAVAFRRVVELDPSLTYGWYKLAYALQKGNRKEEAQQAYQVYRDSSGSEQLLSIDGSSSYVFLVLDVGNGPTLSPDAFTGSFASYSRSYFPERYATVVSDDERAMSRRAEDVYTQAKDEANFAGDATRKVASVAVKQVASMIPVVSWFAGSTAADVRKWLLLPGEIHIALIPASPGPHTTTLKFFDSEGRELPDYQQTWYYVPAGLEGSAPIIHLKSMYRIQDQKGPS